MVKFYKTEKEFKMAKRVADNFIMSDETSKAIGEGLKVGSFGVRLFFYIILL